MRICAAVLAAVIYAVSGANLVQAQTTLTVDPIAVRTVLQNEIASSARSHWAFQPIRKPPPPSVKNEAWIRSPIDRFILAKLEDRGMTPLEPARKQELIRRATYDLIGLPPTPAEVTAYLEDTSSDAFARVVDRLLASPHHGERWGRHWLDVVRYADADMRYQGEQKHPNAWRYRDWVVDAFNRDLPYDQFVQAQLAADLLSKQKDPALLPALGFFSLGLWGYNFDVPYVEIRGVELDDRIDVVTRGFLGLTMACARCHDHKYDPISQKDYYALAGVVASTEYRDYPLVDESVVSAYKAYQKKAQEKQAAIQEFTRTERRQLVDNLVSQTARYMQAAWELLQGSPRPNLAKLAAAEGLYPEALTRWVNYLTPRPRDHTHLAAWDALVKHGGSTEEVRRVAEQFQNVVLPLHLEKKRLDEHNAELEKKSAVVNKGKGRTVKPGGIIHTEDCSNCELNAEALDRDRYYFWNELFATPFLGFLDEPEKARLEKMKSELATIEESKPKDYPFIMAMADSEQPMNVPLNIRGNVRNLAEEVPRGLPSILGECGQPLHPSSGSGRLELARAIVAHPLSARVMVNRVWMHHFGQGIVGSPSNFGKLGDPPTHPQLLDYLAARFKENHWSVKGLHREIMLSATYQLSTRHSARNAELDAGNHLYWRANRRRLDVEALRDSLLAVAGNLDKEIGGEAEELTLEHHRRTLYGWISRKNVDGLLRLFDFPDPNLSNEERDATNVPLQSLFFLNGPLMNQQADVLAKRLTKDLEPEESRIRRAYLLLYGHSATEEEIRLGRDFLAKASADSGGPAAWQQYAQALLSASEFYFVD